MKAITKVIIMSGLIAVLAISGFAQDNADEAAMPPMGAPDEIKSLSWLIGTWDFEMEWKMAPEDTAWTTSVGTCAYSFELDSCVLKTTSESSMMGMPFVGHLYESYDRMTQQFQSIWIDNMMARMSYYTGFKKDNTMVMTGEEMTMTGETVLSRITTYNETPESFDWKMEMSENDGETWLLVGRAVYTKRN